MSSKGGTKRPLPAEAEPGCSRCFATYEVTADANNPGSQYCSACWSSFACEEPAEEPEPEEPPEYGTHYELAR